MRRKNKMLTKEEKRHISILTKEGWSYQEIAEEIRDTRNRWNSKILCDEVEAYIKEQTL